MSTELRRFASKAKSKSQSKKHISLFALTSVATIVLAEILKQAQAKQETLQHQSSSTLQNNSTLTIEAIDTFVLNTDEANSDTLTLAENKNVAVDIHDAHLMEQTTTGDTVSESIPMTNEVNIETLNHSDTLSTESASTFSGVTAQLSGGETAATDAASSGSKAGWIAGAVLLGGGGLAMAGGGGGGGGGSAGDGGSASSAATGDNATDIKNPPAEDIEITSALIRQAVIDANNVDIELDKMVDALGNEEKSIAEIRAELETTSLTAEQVDNILVVVEYVVDSNILLLDNYGKDVFDKIEDAINDGLSPEEVPAFVEQELGVTLTPQEKDAITNLIIFHQTKNEIKALQEASDVLAVLMSEGLVTDDTPEDLLEKDNGEFIDKLREFAELYENGERTENGENPATAFGEYMRDKDIYGYAGQALHPKSTLEALYPVLQADDGSSDDAEEPGDGSGDDPGDGSGDGSDDPLAPTELQEALATVASRDIASGSDDAIQMPKEALLIAIDTTGDGSNDKLIIDQIQEASETATVGEFTTILTAPSALTGTLDGLDPNTVENLYLMLHTQTFADEDGDGIPKSVDQDDDDPNNTTVVDPTAGDGNGDGSGGDDPGDGGDGSNENLPRTLQEIHETDGLDGQLVITEMMIDPMSNQDEESLQITTNGIGEELFEWIEIYNPNDYAMDISGLIVSNLSGKAQLNANTIIESKTWISLSLYQHEYPNGQGSTVSSAKLDLHQSSEFKYADDMDIVQLIYQNESTQTEVVIDDVPYNSEFPIIEGHAVTLDPGTNNSTQNHQSTLWSSSESEINDMTVSINGAPGPNVVEAFGTPGLSNELDLVWGG